MPIKKSELYASLWKSCDELRGGMDASQYKDYVLVLLFVKYVSDKASSQKDYVLDVPKGGSFADMVALKGNKEIGEKIQKVIQKLAEANGLKGVIDVADFNDADKLGKGKEMVDRLSNLVGIFEDPALDFRGNRAEGDDLLGDAYEYLMRHFATESGKSKGQFYTPSEVSRVMAKVVGVGHAKDNKQTIYDPTCGSGSLLLKAHDEAKSTAGRDLAVYGQEMDNATYALAKMNLILHGCETGEIWKDNTLSAPYFKDPKTAGLKTFDFIVANPPFSTKAWSNGFDPFDDPWDRFALGVPPKKNGDYAFLLHVLASLKSHGKAAVILPHGVLFRGNTEAAIRKQLIERGVIKAIIGLPANLFYGTGIPACIVVLDKEHARARRGIFMIDASKAFLKDGNKNRLRAQDIHKIVDAVTQLRDIPRYARMVPLSEISDPKNDFNLNLPRYVDTSEPEDIQDIEAHLKGGLPDRDIDGLERYWQVLPGVRKALFTRERKGYQRLRVAAADVKRTIFEHAEFTALRADVDARFAKWRSRARALLKKIDKATRPKDLAATLAEDLLKTFDDAPLLDAYDLYQRFMDYWESTMQDDVYLLVSDGWLPAAKPRLIGEAERKAKVKPDFVVAKQGFKAELVGPQLVIARYFAKDHAALEALEAEHARARQAVEDLVEEHGAEDGLLEEVKNDKGKVTKALVLARLEEIAGDEEMAEERKVLKAYVVLSDAVASAGAAVKDAEAGLMVKVLGRYRILTAADVEALVLDAKWMSTLSALAASELERVSQALAARVWELGERYKVPLPVLMQHLAALDARLDTHLAAIQLLLDGRRRPGAASTSWAPIGLGQLGRWFSGGTPSMSVAEFWDGDIPWVSPKDMKVAHIADTVDHVTQSAIGNGTSLAPANTILIVVRGMILAHSLPVAKATRAVAFNQDIRALVVHPQHHPDFVLWKLMSAKAALMGLITESTHGTKRLSSQSMMEFEFEMPELAEQIAIAEVLTDMDAEITALEARRDKTRAIKEGMMQALLTGKVRLL